MKYPFFWCFLIFLGGRAFGQNKVTDSLQHAFTIAKADTLRAKILLDMGDAYAQNQPDSELFKAQQALFISRRIKFIDGELQSLKQIAESYASMGNYPIALHFYLERLYLDEKYPDPKKQTVTLLSIANLYQSEGDYLQAIAYMKKAYALIDKHQLEYYRWYSYTYFGDFYEKIGNIPKAIYYDKTAYELALKKDNSSWVGMSLNNTGNAYAKNKQYQEALGYYYRGIPYLKKDNNERFLCDSYDGIASVLYQLGKLDSAAYYAKSSLKLATSRNFSNHYMVSCQLLSNIYKAQKLADSAVIYQGRLLVMRDSIYSQEKMKQIENLTIMEKFRQKDLQEQKLLEEKQTAYKLNMLMIGLMIPFFFLVSVFLSKRKINARIVEFSGLISLLMVFEYLNLVLHHLVGTVTDDSPILEILILVAIAAVLTPSHHRIERWVLQNITHKTHHDKFKEISFEKPSSGESVKGQEK